MRRRRTFHICGIGLLLLVGLLLMSLTLLQRVGEAAYRDQRAEQARARWGAVLAVNAVQRDIAPFNVGLAEYLAGDPRAAAARFAQAMEAAPAERRCAALRNLVLSLEAYADSLDGIEDELDRERQQRRALRLIEQAPQCLASDATDQESAEQLAQARARLQQRTVPRPAAGEEASRRDSDEQSPYDVPAPEAQEQLQQLQQAAERARAGAADLARSRSVNARPIDDPKY